MRVRLVKEPFNGPDYIFELKHDGFRVLAYIERGECKLVSRHLKHLQFKALEEALATHPVQNTIIDSEIICIDVNGVSQFNELLSRKAEPVLHAFDLLWLNGDDLLILRKDRLAALIRLSDCNRIMSAQHVEGESKRLFAEICRCDLEGVVAKRKMGIYKDDGSAWLKIKNRKYSQAEGRHELLTRRRAQSKL